MAERRNDIEQKISEELNKFFSEQHTYTLEWEFLYKNQRRADFMILKDGQVFVAIEVKGDLENSRQFAYGVQQLRDSQYEFYLQYGILTDGKSYILINLLNLKVVEKRSSFSEIFKILETYKSGSKSGEDILTTCQNEIRGIFKSSNMLKTINVDALSIIEKNEVLCLSETDELELFNALVPDECDAHLLCRYASIFTLFATIDNSSYRLNASEGMNDREDCNFLWNRINSDYVRDDKYRPNRTLEPTYMMSCASPEKEDDLTMWRLYGDDAKGVCMVLEIGTLPDGFFLRKVRYDEELIAMLSKVVSSAANYGYRFVFNYWELWGAFIKSRDYAIESEVRLVYLESRASWKPKNTKKWVLTNSNQMPNKYVEFEVAPSTLFPLKLKKVIIGPECLEKDVVCSQFKKMMEESVGFKGVKVEISQKESYRTSRK